MTIIYNIMEIGQIIIHACTVVWWGVRHTGKSRSLCPEVRFVLLTFFSFKIWIPSDEQHPGKNHPLKPLIVKSARTLARLVEPLFLPCVISRLEHNPDNRISPSHSPSEEGDNKTVVKTEIVVPAEMMTYIMSTVKIRYTGSIRYLGPARGLYLEQQNKSLYASKDKRKNLSTDERTVLFKSALQLAHARCIAPSERFDQGHTSDITMSGRNY